MLVCLSFFDRRISAMTSLKMKNLTKQKTFFLLYRLTHSLWRKTKLATNDTLNICTKRHSMINLCFLFLIFLFALLWKKRGMRVVVKEKAENVIFTESLSISPNTWLVWWPHWFSTTPQVLMLCVLVALFSSMEVLFTVKDPQTATEKGDDFLLTYPHASVNIFLQWR